MKSLLKYFGLMGCAAALLSPTTWASAPTFSLKLAGINGQIFRDIYCVGNGDCPPGSECVPTEVVFPGYFEDRCGPISVIPEAMIEPGDTITIEAFIRGWDTDPEVGKCSGEAAEECNFESPDCRRDHCQSTGTYCHDADDCPDGDVCIPDECLATPLLGSFQWIMDAFTFSSTTIPAARALSIATFSCEGNTDCWHGADCSHLRRCTCCNAECYLGGYCSIEASAYIDLARFDYPFPWQPDLTTVYVGFPVFPDAHFMASMIYGGVRERGHCEGGSNANSICFLDSDCDSGACRRTDRYLGTLWLDVPVRAGGRYVLDFVRGFEFTYATDERGISLGLPTYEPLTIELCDPCVDFDVAQVCPPPPNVCQVYACYPNDCVAECIRMPRACEDSCCGCVVEEDGCVPFGACCHEDETCSQKSEAQCKAAGGNYKGDCVDCGPDTCKAYGACCIPPPWICVEAFEENCPGEFKGDGTVCRDGRICNDDDFCPAGSMTFTDPLDGTIDARQARDINNTAVPQGIDTIMATGPEGATDLDCWELCETIPEGFDNQIVSLTEDTPGSYTITLKRRITPGAVTKITYTPIPGSASVGTFTSLPADSNANGVSNTADILSLIDCCLNGVCTPPFGVYSCDIDRSGVVNTADILRVIDLLNGAGGFWRSWNMETPYDNGKCPD